MFRRVLVTGGNGFVGRFFLASLKQACPDTEIFLGQRTRDGGDAHEVHLDLMRPIELDIEVDIVFHLGGEKRDEEKMWEVNFAGTRRLMEWSAHHGVKRFVYLSSVGVYGARKNSGTITEVFPREPQNRYEESKNAAELFVKKVCREQAINYVVLQPTNVIGINHRGAYPLLGLMRSIKNGYFVFFKDGSAWLNYISVEDVAHALLLAMKEKANNKTFILNTPIELRKAVEIIANEMKVPVPHRTIPNSLGYLAGELASILSVLTRKNIPFSRQRYRELTNNTLYDGTTITKTTGFPYPVGIISALQELVHYYTSKGLL